MIPGTIQEAVGGAYSSLALVRVGGAPTEILGGVYNGQSRRWRKLSHHSLNNGKDRGQYLKKERNGKKEGAADKITG